MPKGKRKLTLKQRRERARTLIVFGGVFAFAVLIGGGIFGLHRPEVTIASVEVEGAHYTREDLVQQFATSMLKGSYFFLIPRSSTFFYPRHAMIRDAQGLFPAVQSIEIRRDHFTSLHIRITERETSAWWCTSLSSSTSCYLMDEHGFIFTKAEESRNDVLVYTGGVTAQPPATTFLNGGYASLSVFVADTAQATGRTPESVSVDEHEDVTIFFKEGGELRFSYQSAHDALLENIASVFASRRFHSDEILEYADFRFGNKIYVKFKGE